MSNQVVNNSASASQTVALSSAKASVSTQAEQAALTNELIMPKSLAEKLALGKETHFSVGHQLMASSLAHKVSGMSLEQMKKTLNKLGITQENHAEFIQSAMAKFGDELNPFIEQILSNVGIELPPSDNSNPYEQYAVVLKINPFIVMLMLNMKGTQIQNKALATTQLHLNQLNTLANIQTTGLGEQVDSIKHEESKQDTHWWQKALKIVVPILIGVGVAVAANLILPGIGFAMDAVMAGYETFTDAAVETEIEMESATDMLDSSGSEEDVEISSDEAVDSDVYSSDSTEFEAMDHSETEEVAQEQRAKSARSLKEAISEFGDAYAKRREVREELGYPGKGGKVEKILNLVGYGSVVALPMALITYETSIKSSKIGNKIAGYQTKAQQIQLVANNYQAQVQAGNSQIQNINQSKQAFAYSMADALQAMLKETPPVQG